MRTGPGSASWSGRRAKEILGRGETPGSSGGGLEWCRVVEVTTAGKKEERVHY